LNDKTFEDTWKKLMDSPDGEVILRNLLEMYSLRTSHVRGDPYETAFREGQRDVVNFLLTLVREQTGN
tara:strand:- start:307 stop:510 length:204 start_codon:yes stop_codon:yes gene_type:complete